LDVGILWNNDDSVGNSNDSLLPTFNRLVPTTDDSLIEYANQILARSDNEQDDARKKSDSRKSSLKKDAERGRRKPKEIRIEPEEVESDDDYAIPDVNDDDDEGGEELPEEVGGDQPLIMDNEALVQSLLKKVPIDRSLIKKQSMRVLNYQLDPINDNEAADDGDTSDVNEHDAEESITGTKQVDPMALTMVKSTISKYLSQITRGETSAASAARFVASVMQNGDSARRDLINLAIMTLYHCNVAFDDVAELVYSTSSSLRSTQEGSANESSCAPPWGNMLCPPRTVQVGGKTYPPAFVVEAARKRCNERQKSTEEVCVVAEEDDVEFPTSVSDGYYNYYAPQARTADDALTSYFLTTASQQIVPPGLSELRQRKNTIDEQRVSLMKRISDLESEIGDNNGTSKYGVDGELFILRGTCHKLEHGKYEYEVCIFGQATQRDIGQTHGGTNLGSWEAESIEDGQRKLKWGGGTKCWNGPVRSAEVYVTCGAETNLLTADEPETCRYVFTMESPIGCDERISI
jgi:hypothetical protein